MTRCPTCGAEATEALHTSPAGVSWMAYQHTATEAADRIEALEAALRDIGDTPFYAMRGLMAKRALLGEPLLTWREGAELPS